jgi:tetratricopeptide (TPR) repeat protein
MRKSTTAVLALSSAIAMAQTPSDFSADLDKLWNFAKPDESQARFRAELAKHAKDSPQALEIATQIARTQSISGKFAEADKILDAVQPKIGDSPERVKVRYFLERGRTRNSSGDPPAAVALFKEALELSERDKAPGADYYRVDALHMLGIAAPLEEQLGWSEKALAEANRSTEARARGWAAALHNNIGWTYFDRGDYATALDHWHKAVPLREATGNPTTIRIAKWTVARGLRATGKLDEAKKMQLALVAETEAANAPDGYVYEELAEIAVAQGDKDAARTWAGKAHALLKNDPGMEGARLTRLAKLADGKAP